MKVHVLDANALYRFLIGGPGAEAVARFQAHLRAAGLSASTVRTYGTLAGEFVAFTGTRGGLARLLAAANNLRDDQRGENTDDGDHQQHFDEREGAAENSSGGTGSTSPKMILPVSQGLAALVPPKVVGFDFHKFVKVI